MSPLTGTRSIAQPKVYRRGFLQSSITISHRSLNYRHLRFASSEARVDPLLHVIESIFHSVGVLSRRSFASGTGPDSVGGAFDHNILFVGASGHLIVNLIVAQKIMAAHS